MLVGWTLLKPCGNEDEEEMEVEEIGEISDFLDIPGNPCLEIQVSENTEKRVIVPLHEDLILSVDPENREIIIDIPEGLL